MIGLGQEGVAWGWPELSKIPQKGVEQKEGMGTKAFKKGGGQAGSRGGCLKKGAGFLLQTVKNSVEGKEFPVLNNPNLISKDQMAPKLV